MKYHYVLAATMLLMLSSCVNKDTLPENPKDKQEHIDKSGNHWIYDYALMRWIMTPTGGGPNYYYYPGTNKWTNSTGASVSKPSTVKISTMSTHKSSRPSNTGKSFGSSHSVSRGS